MKLSNISKFVVLIFGVAAMFTACNKEEAEIANTNDIIINEIQKKQDNAKSVDFFDATPDFKLTGEEVLFTSDEFDVTIAGSTLKARQIGTKIWTTTDIETNGNFMPFWWFVPENGGYYYLWADIEGTDGDWRFPTVADVQSLVSGVNGYVARIPLLLNLTKGNPWTWDGVNLVTNSDGSTWFTATDSYIFWSNTIVTNPPSGYDEGISINGSSLAYRQLAAGSCIKVRLVKDL